MPKKARINIDLALDDDDDPVIVKSEDVDASEHRTGKREREEDLERRIKRVQRRRAILELKEEEDELQRELDKTRAKGKTAVRVKNEATIKIED